MISRVEISNFKSVQELSLDLGRINVFIGENGSGKTSILEAIAFGSAASQDKLDEEFLVSRGIRVVEPKLMKSGFNKNNIENNIIVHFTDSNRGTRRLQIKSGGFWQPWTLSIKSDRSLDANDLSRNIVKEIAEKYPGIAVSLEELESISQKLSELLKGQEHELNQKNLHTYLAYAPENFFLRRFEEEGQIRPLGIRGEGLFKHLVDLMKENPETVAKISAHLKSIDWFEEFSIPSDLMFSERRINIVDKYLKDNISYIDQRSSNEGFLYLLFYYTLFLSQHTPKFFSIDNIDNALNPKLCIKLVQTLAQLSKENDKQAILTTHNPAILDGLDLNDDDQRLFVIYRNADGHTTAHRVMAPKAKNGVEPVRLSEAFIKGYLGGLPTHF